MINPSQPPTSVAAGARGPTIPDASMSQVERERVYQWISELTSPDTRENALQELRFYFLQISKNLNLY